MQHFASPIFEQLHFSLDEASAVDDSALDKFPELVECMQCWDRYMDSSFAVAAGLSSLSLSVLAAHEGFPFRVPGGLCPW